MLREIQFQVTSKNEARKTPNVTGAKKICEIVIVEGDTEHNFLITKMLRKVQFHVTRNNETSKTPNVTVAKKISEIVIVKGYTKYNFLTTKMLRDPISCHKKE
jgi:hypothetical protein